MSSDPFNQMTHGANRQFNRQNPAFDHRPLDCYHLATNAKWPEAQRWHYSSGGVQRGQENAAGGYTTAATAARLARNGNGGEPRRQRTSLAPQYDLTLTPELLLAALHDDGARIKDLVTRGAWTECRTESGATPLICAAAKGAGDAIEALLEAGANPVASDAVVGLALVTTLSLLCSQNTNLMTASVAHVVTNLMTPPGSDDHTRWAPPRSRSRRSTGDSRR
jgi:ankyrin repeat protein